MDRDNVAAPGFSGKTEVPIFKVNLAGRTVAKCLVAGELGYGMDEIISHLDIVGPAQAVIGGPWFSRQMGTASAQFRKGFCPEGGVLALNESEAQAAWSGIIALSREAGVDVAGWFDVRVFEAVSGPVAEAIVSNRLFADVWQNAIEDCYTIGFHSEVLGLSESDLSTIIDRMAFVSAAYLDRPPIWAAVRALASKLPDRGRIDGRKAAQIIGEHLPPDMRCCFAATVRVISYIEREIEDHDTVAVSIPGEAVYVVKGGAEVEKAGRTGGSVHFIAPEYECRSPVFAETFCRALGDGYLVTSS